MLGALLRSGRVTHVLLALMIVAYAITAGGLALRRHSNLESHALDMGYADQITWNMGQGRLFRFTVFRGEVGEELGRALDYGPGADRDSLFAYHVELLFLPLALLYLIYPGPESLIVLLTVVLALGALPVYWIARERLRHRWAALGFAAMYLSFPSIQAANLADFHIVSMTGSLLLFALYFLLVKRYWAFIALAVVCAAAREEVGLLVGMMGLYAWLVQGRRRLGIAVAGLAFAWVAISFGVIMPHFNGGAPSLFAARYYDASVHLRIFFTERIGDAPTGPVPQFTLTYLVNMLASTGFLAVLAPIQLALAAPALAINGLSGSTWQHGGGAHYSAEVVPALIVAAIYGTGSLARKCQRWLKAPPATAALGITMVGLAAALGQSWRQGVLPPGQRFALPPASAHAARLRPLLQDIPPDATVSAQTGIYPQLSGRTKAYVYPAVDDADYVLIDVTGPSDPLTPDQLFREVSSLIADERFTLRSGDDGFLLFQRQPPGASLARSTAPTLPPSFYSFASATPGERFKQVQASFAAKLEVVGYRVELLPELRFSIRSARVVVYFRARQPLDRAYRLPLFVVGPEKIAQPIDGGNAVRLWYPTDRWQQGELIRVRYPPIAYSSGGQLGIGVQFGDIGDASRLRLTSTDSPIVDGGHVLVLGPLP